MGCVRGKKNSGAGSDWSQDDWLLPLVVFCLKAALRRRAALHLAHSGPLVGNSMLCGKKEDVSGEKSESELVVEIDSPELENLAGSGPGSPRKQQPWLDESLPFLERLVLSVIDGDASLVRAALTRSDLGGSTFLYEARDRDGDTLLHVAARAGNFEVARLLVCADHTAPPAGYIDMKTSAGETATHIALSSNYVQIAQMLVACGIDILQKNSSNENVLYLAAFMNEAAVLQAIFQRAEKQQEAVREKVIACLREVNCDGLTALMVASIRGNNEARDTINRFLATIHHC